MNSVLSSIAPFWLSLDPSKTEHIKLAADETFKIVFTVFDDEKNADVVPHQAFLRFWDEQTEEEGIVPVKVARDGKAKFSMVRWCRVPSKTSFAEGISSERPQTSDGSATYDREPAQGVAYPRLVHVRGRRHPDI